MLHSSSRASTASTRSRESAFRSSANRASGTTCCSSTASCSASTFFTLVSISTRSMLPLFLVFLASLLGFSRLAALVVCVRLGEPIGGAGGRLGGEPAIHRDHGAVHVGR